MATNARLEELKKKFDENPRRYFAPLANEYRKQGDLTHAITLCRAHLPNQPGHISGHIVLAQALFEAQELPESRQIFEQSLELDPENLIALRTLGDIARSQGDVLIARSWYERVLEADPRNDEIAVLLREIAGQIAAMPENPASQTERPPFEAQASFVEPAAHEQSSVGAVVEEPADRWDPDKTPVSSIAIPDPDSVPSYFHVSRSAPEPDSSDIFGDGVEDQGAALLEGFEPFAAGELEFVILPETASADASSPSTLVPEAHTDEAELNFDAAEPEVVGEAAPHVAEVETEQERVVESVGFEFAAPEVRVLPENTVFEADLAVSGPKVVADDAEPVTRGELARDEVLQASATFEEDADAFAAAQHLSDPEAHPEQYSDDWFTAPTPTHGVAQVQEAEVPSRSATPQETFVLPTPASGAESQATKVELDTFDLIENGRASDAASFVASSSMDHAVSEAGALSTEELSGSWFDHPVKGSRSEPPGVDPEGLAEPVAPSRAMEFESAPTMSFESAVMDHVEPPQVELEVEPEPVAIERGIEELDAPHEAIEYESAAVAASGFADPTLGRTIQEGSEPAGEMPQMFVTETMAELYLQQGFTEEALQVYRRLLERNPGDEEIRSRIVALETGAPSSVAEAASAAHAVDRAGQSVRNFFGRIARRQPTRRKGNQSALDVASLGVQMAARQGTSEAPAEKGVALTLTELFASAQRREDDDAAARRLASAFAPPEAAGRPTRVADSELSLDHLFRDVPPESSGAVTLDAFFAATGGDTSEASNSADQAGDEEQTGDIEQFTAWLEGLKKK